jgi:hypothetical protein
MENIKLNFAHICENAFLSKEGKINIIGDFDVAFIKRVDPKAPLFFSFYLVTNFSVDSGKEYQQEFLLLKSSDRSEITKRSIKQMASTKKIGLLMRIDVIFPEIGEYKVVIKLNNKIYNELSIQINERK